MQVGLKFRNLPTYQQSSKHLTENIVTNVKAAFLYVYPMTTSESPAVPVKMQIPGLTPDLLSHL